MPARAERWTSAIALAIAAAALVAALRWTSSHPLPLWFDEANYANQAFDDRAAVQRGGPVAGVKALLFNDPLRPPAYRAFALPFAALHRPPLGMLRALALTVTLLAMAILWLTTRSPLAAAIVFATPAVWSAGAWFGTEFPLLLAVALLMFALIPRVRPAVLTIAVALGLLSKATFLVIAGPVVLVALFFSDRLRIFIASLAGALIALAWWGWHLVPALQFAQLGRTFPRATFHVPTSKLYVFVHDALGPALFAVVILLILFNTRGDRRTIAIAAAGALPLLALAFASSVFVPRHLAPALLPLAVLLAIALARISPRVRLAAALLVLAQTIAVAAGLLTVVPQDIIQTDWRILRPLVRKSNPRITFLGGRPSLTRAEIRYAWTRDDETASVAPLWTADERAIDWTRVMQRALASDLVLVVAPGATLPPGSDSYGVLPADNEHNAELVARLDRTPAFERVPLATDVIVYRRR